MATSTMVPLEEYLRTSYAPDCEWLDGEVRERKMGEQSHVRVQVFFITSFGARKEALGIRVDAEQRVQVSGERFRVPDVSLMRVGDPYEEIVRTPPLLSIEVLSRDDRMAEMEEKIDDYLKMGVRAVWVVNPQARSASVFTVEGSRRVTELTVEGTAIRVSLAEVFAELDAAEAGRHLRVGLGEED